MVCTHKPINHIHDFKKWTNHKLKYKKTLKQKNFKNEYKYNNNNIKNVKEMTTTVRKTTNIYNTIGDIKHHVLGISSYHTSTIDHTMFDL